MYKCLEEMKRLKWGWDITHEEHIYLCECIEKELEDKEQLEKAFDTLSKENEKVMKELSKEIEKNRALEIIEEKGIILQFIKETYTVEQYNAGVYGTLVKPLTQEEYDLLKEVML